jgi:hypothetical protein
VLIAVACFKVLEGLMKTIKTIGNDKNVSRLIFEAGYKKQEYQYSTTLGTRILENLVKCSVVIDCL